MALFSGLAIDQFGHGDGEWITIENIIHLAFGAEQGFQFANVYLHLCQVAIDELFAQMEHEIEIMMRIGIAFLL